MIKANDNDLPGKDQKKEEAWKLKESGWSRHSEKKNADTASAESGTSKQNDRNNSEDRQIRKISSEPDQSPAIISEQQTGGPGKPTA